MAGLLDNITEDQMLGGLLGAGTASGAKGNFLARMAAGIGAGERFSQGRREEARQRSQDEMRAEYQKLMMLKMQRDAQQQEAAAAQGAANTDAVRGSLGQFDPRQFLQQNPKADLSGLEQAVKLNQMITPKASKFSTAPQYDQNGRAFILSDDGQIKYLDGVKARDKLVSEDLGGKKGFRTEYSPEMVGMAEKTMTPDAKASNALGWANNAATLRGQDLTNARANEGTWAMNNDTGYMVNSRSGEARAAVGLDGKPIGPKMSESTKKELMSINQQRSIINGALNAVTATPDAFSFSRGFTGQIPYGESLAGRMESPGQTQARAYVFNNVSRIINERAGAAQSAQELQRLRSFLPADTDGPEQIKNKLQGFSTYLNDLESGTKGDPVKVGDPNSSNTSSPKKADWVYKNGKLVKAN